MCLIQDIANCLKEANRDVYPDIFTLLTIGCALPVYSCEAERSFSGLRRIKTFLRSSMGIERLAGLTLMHLHNDLDIDEDKICQLFKASITVGCFSHACYLNQLNVYVLVFILHVTLKFFFMIVLLPAIMALNL